MRLSTVLVVLSLGGLACASAPPQPPIDAAVLQPGPREQVDVDHLVVIVDASSSVAGPLFETEKNLAASFAESMPEGSYQVRSIGFGGFARERTEPARFERSRVRSAAEELSNLAEGTPLHRVLEEAGAELQGAGGRAAVVVYSDGLATDEIGRPVGDERVLGAAEAFREGYGGQVCFHTVQVGSDPRGTALLRRLAQTTDCGTYRTAATVTGAASLHQFQREVFLGAKPMPATPPVAAAPSDLDGDGVYDRDDQCPGTPRSAPVDERGCWSASPVYFASGSARIPSEDREGLEEVARVLRDNPRLRIRIDGHTDSAGSAEENEALSKRRARAVRDDLVAAGISSDRLETRAWGETRPTASNDTDEGKRVNRRAEISVLR